MALGAESHLRSQPRPKMIFNERPFTQPTANAWPPRPTLPGAETDGRKRQTLGGRRGAARTFIGPPSRRASARQYAQAQAERGGGWGDNTQPITVCGELHRQWRYRGVWCTIKSPFRTAALFFYFGKTRESVFLGSALVPGPWKSVGIRAEAPSGGRSPIETTSGRKAEYPSESLLFCL